jgi:DNA-directed RNA polymerase specialized sigma24 family protein
MIGSTGCSGSIGASSGGCFVSGVCRPTSPRTRLQLQEGLDVLDERAPTLDDRKSALDMVGKILSRVDAPLVEVFVLYEIAEFSSFEIAELLGVRSGRPHGADASAGAG